MIRGGKDDGTGVFPMHKKRENQLYTLLYYSNDQQIINVFGGIFSTHIAALKYLFSCGYTDICDDDDDQILVRHSDPEWPSYVRIKKFSIDQGVLAGGIVNGKSVYFVPRFWQ